MIHLYYGNQTEALCDQLIANMKAERLAHASWLRSVSVLVPNRAMERYIELATAETLGIAANVRFFRLETLFSQWVEHALGKQLFRREDYENFALKAFLDNDFLATPDMKEAALYLRAGSDQDAFDQRCVQLATRVGHLFEGYTYARPELLEAFCKTPFDADTANHPDLLWQQALYQHMVSNHPSWCALPDALHLLTQHSKNSKDQLSFQKMLPNPLHQELHVFGLSYIARVAQWAFAVLGKHINLHLYVLNPCMEFWEDVVSEKEQYAQRQKQKQQPKQTSNPGMSQLAEEKDNMALHLWGRPGREHVRMLHELTDADFEPCFRDPIPENKHPENTNPTPTLLHAFQHDMLRRHPTPSSPTKTDHAYQADRSIRAFACPSARREVETLAESIWELVYQNEQRTTNAENPANAENPTLNGKLLRFNDIAVFVHAADREQYFPLIESVFSEAHHIPHNIMDIDLAAVSGIVDACTRLVALPRSSFSRREVFDLVTHPAVCARFPGISPEAWATLVDNLGIFHGIDHHDHEGTYIDHDLFNWDQAIRRIALGAWLGTPNADSLAYETVQLGDNIYFPEESRGLFGVELAALVRSLSADAQFARKQHLTLSEWATFFEGLFQSYVIPENERDAADLRRCVSAASQLATRDIGDKRVSYRIASDLMQKALSSLKDARGEFLADGVVVSSFVPMRSIPFQAVFVLGMGESRFPTQERQDASDLRALENKPGDVSAIERDQYMFLEALLCAREHFWVSWVARDAVSGDSVAPSSTVKQWLAILERSYLPNAQEQLVSYPALHRHNALLTNTLSSNTLSDVGPVFPEQIEEARARLLGQAHREANPSASNIQKLNNINNINNVNNETASFLRIPTSPNKPAPTFPATLSLHQLRKFLHSPMQAWAKSVLGMREPQEDTLHTLEDEPFSPAWLTQRSLLQHIFLRHLHQQNTQPSPQTLRQIYHTEITKLQASGKWPIGILEETQRVQTLETLTGWDNVYAQLTDTLYANSNADSKTSLTHYQFGNTLNQHKRHTSFTSEQLCPCIPLEVPTENGVQVIEITGRTAAILPTTDTNSRNTLFLNHTHININASKQKSIRWKHALDAFIDHLALTCGDAPTAHTNNIHINNSTGAQTHHVHILYAGTQDHITLQAVEPTQARHALTHLVTNFLTHTHDYRLPSDAVLSTPNKWPTLTGEKLVANIEKLNSDNNKGGRDRWGPVPRVTTHPIPDADTALRMAKQRFGLFFDITS